MESHRNELILIIFLISYFYFFSFDIVFWFIFKEWENWEEVASPEFSTSWGLLDMGYRTETEVWAAGGSGNLLVSRDDGATWEKDREVEEVPSNLYKVVFISPDQGFVLGQNGILLKYQSETKEA